MPIDLHTHSDRSDGTEAPAEVIWAAAVAGIDIVGLADHDTTAGWGEAERACATLGIEFVPAVEVSCRWSGMSVHLLALWPSGADEQFLAIIARTRQARIGRAREIVALLGKDFPLDWEGVVARSTSAATVGRPHIADALVDAGVVATRDAAFADLLGSDSPYYVPHYAPEVSDAVTAVVAAGGVPVLAHPGADGRGRVLPDEAIEALAANGLVGIEVDHRDHSDAQRERLAALASGLGLVRTGSSDYHGTGKLNRLGENITSPEAFARLLAARS